MIFNLVVKKGVSVISVISKVSICSVYGPSRFSLKICWRKGVFSEFFLKSIIHLVNYVWREKTPTQSGSLRSTKAASKASTTQTSEKSAKHTLSDVSSISEISYESGHLTDKLGSIKR